MNRQQINLYRLVLSTRPQQRRARLWRITFAGLASVAFMYCIVLAGDVAMKRWSLHAVSEQSMQMSDKISALKSQMVAPDGGDSTTSFAALNDRFQHAERERRTLEPLISLPSPGFSSTFVALARQHLQGLWLTRVDRGAQIESLQVKGRAIDPALVPKFVQRLAREPALQGVSFQLLKIYVPEENEPVAKGVIEFVAGHEQGGGP